MLLEKWSESASDASVLSAAVFMKYPHDFVDMVIDLYPSNSHLRLRGRGGGYSTPLSLEKAKIFSRVLSKVHTLELEGDMEPSAFVHFMSCLVAEESSVKKIQTMWLPCLSDETIDVQNEVLRSFRLLASTKKNVDYGKLQLPDRIEDALHWLELLGEEPGPFDSVVFDEEAAFCYFKMELTLPSSWVTIRGMDFKSPGHAALFEKVSRLPTSRTLCLELCRNVDLATTVFIPQLLHQPHCPTTEIRINETADLSLVYEALKHNKTLTSIHCYDFRLRHESNLVFVSHKHVRQQNSSGKSGQAESRSAPTCAAGNLPAATSIITAQRSNASSWPTIATLCQEASAPTASLATETACPPSVG